jgi:hypothetical protein
MNNKIFLLVYILFIVILNASEVKPFSFFDITLGESPQGKWKQNIKLESPDLYHLGSNYKKLNENRIMTNNRSTIYSCTYNFEKAYPLLRYMSISQKQNRCIEKNIYSQYNPKTDKLPYSKISFETTLENDIVYRIAIQFKENYFSNFEECENYMLDIINNMKKKRKNLEYIKRNEDDSDAIERWYFLDNSKGQTMMMKCKGIYKQNMKKGFFDFFKEKKIDYVTAEISYWDNNLEKKVKDDYKRKKEEKKREKREKKKKEEDLKRINKNKSINLFY